MNGALLIVIFLVLIFRNSSAIRWLIILLRIMLCVVVVMTLIVTMTATSFGYEVNSISLAVTAVCFSTGVITLIYRMKYENKKRKIGQNNEYKLNRKLNL